MTEKDLKTLKYFLKRFKYLRTSTVGERITGGKVYGQIDLFTDDMVLREINELISKLEKK